MKFSFVNLFFSCFEGKKFHYIVIKINENHIYRFINNTGKIKLRDIHSKDGITEITFNYKDKNHWYNKFIETVSKNSLGIYLIHIIIIRILNSVITETLPIGIRIIKVIFIFLVSLGVTLIIKKIPKINKIIEF